ncbi:hypothetical protein KKC44_01170 [Patescibacteria group bacterium]|nr:hypothetical protein [Patescibacteria group bacterium]
MLYPVGFLWVIGEILMQIDFIGPRYIEGNPQPLHFFSARYIRPFRMHIFFRITAQTTNEALRCLYLMFFELGYPLPDAIQMDNDAAFRGYTKKGGTIGRIIKWICHNGSIPVFNAPNSPWNNGAVEGGNSVFDRKFWNRFRFNSVKDIDQKLDAFNEEYRMYLRTECPVPKRPIPTPDPRKVLKKNLSFSQPFLFLLRVVRQGKIDVVGRSVRIPDQFKGQYVIVQIHMDNNWMKVWQETNTASHLIIYRAFNM